MSRNLQALKHAPRHARPDRTAFPPESGCKDTHSCGTGKQNKGLFLKKIRGKSFGGKKEGKETDTSIILYIRTEDEGNRYKKRRKTLLFFLVHLFRLNYVSHNQACSTAQKHTCTINDRNRTSHKPIIMFVIKILRQSNSHNRIAYQKP